MAPSSLRTAAAFLLVLLVAVAPSLPQLQAARTVPNDGGQQVTDTTVIGSSSTPAARPALLTPPPAATIAAPGRSRLLGSVPSPGVGH
ncbi:hypothetical protein C2845_PM07G38040 [Panicum miliaceum]|uniref:Uncharacterized protein n=1 Tax=Panicum miliaceum TaxID=4540 RepID=A0A3L6SJY3_PANMI|nr:hypothetical protein C2845_PM07G38040 [Panicum miliaceum]